ncbi:MAG: hypothetical protein DRJ05_01545 [Bacteroidetes bacterium]|nr:MAG: hypothetical protein DRJ05_01545 [Bacteroidota bacterium]
MDYSIKIDHDNKIIRYRHTGIIKKEDIGNAWESFLKMEEFTKSGYNLLSDYRNSTFDIGVKDVDSVSESMKSFKTFIEGKKQSLILDDGFSTAISVLFVDKVYKKTGFRVKVFSTEEAALRWLLG